MSLENPKKGKMRIVHINDSFDKNPIKKESEIQEIDLDFINKLEFKNPEEKAEAQRLIILIKESKDPKKREGFVFALRDLLNSLG